MIVTSKEEKCTPSSDLLLGECPPALAEALEEGWFLVRLLGVSEPSPAGETTEECSESVRTPEATTSTTPLTPPGSPEVRPLASVGKKMPNRMEEGWLLVECKPIRDCLEGNELIFRESYQEKQQNKVATTPASKDICVPLDDRSRIQYLLQGGHTEIIVHRQTWARYYALILLSLPSPLFYIILLPTLSLL